MISQNEYINRWKTLTLPELKKEEDKLMDKIECTEGGLQEHLIDVLELLKTHIQERMEAENFI